MRLNTSWLSLSNNNRYTILSKVIENISCCDLNNEKLLGEVTVKIRLERINTQEEVTVEVLLDNGAMGLVMSLEFIKKQGFKLKKIEKPICYGMLWTLTFFFFFYLFFLILYFFSFEFLFIFIFIFSNNEKARDITVTCHVTWCDVISLEHSGKI